MEKQEKIGFHKGALDCLIKERNELLRIIAIVESIIKMHMKGLEDEGVNVKEILQNAKQAKEQAEAREMEQNVETPDTDSKEHFTNFEGMIEKKDEEKTEQ